MNRHHVKRDSVPDVFAIESGMQGRDLCKADAHSRFAALGLGRPFGSIRREVAIDLSNKFLGKERLDQ